MEEMKSKEMTIEEQFSQIEEIITKMESQEISLEESFQLYQQGMQQLKTCNEKMNAVEKQIIMINEAGESTVFSEG